MKQIIKKRPGEVEEILEIPMRIWRRFCLSCLLLLFFLFVFSIFFVDVSGRVQGWLYNLIRQRGLQEDREQDNISESLVVYQNQFN